MQDNLMILRKKRNLSIKDMADFIHVQPNTYSLKERGEYEFTQDEMFIISKLFDLTIAEIFLPRSHQIGDKVTV